MMTRTLEFFFDLTSPYSYLASTQLPALAQRTGAKVRWRPLLLGALFKATQNNSPLMVPAKAAYLVQDLEDWREQYQLPPFRLPDQFPFNSLQANRLCLVADGLGRGEELARRAFEAVFVHGKALTEPSRLAELADSIGLAPEEARRRMESPEVKDQLRQNTEEAVARGAYGVPTFFVVGGPQPRMFVGNDRLQFVERALGAQA